MRRWGAGSSGKPWCSTPGRPGDGDVRDEVFNVLATQATTGEMRIDAVARVLAVTPRTLQRRLAKAGTSFENCAMTLGGTQPRFI